MSTLFDFLLLVLGFGLVIFVHELGHFAVAKWVGIKVEQFAIGMGPALASWRKGVGFRSGTTQPEYEARLKAGTPASELGETEYRFNYLPIGGYVKMLGQDDMDMAAVVTDPRSYSSRPIWARMCVVSAGVVMNIIFAILLFVICYMWGVRTPGPVIGGISPDSLAAVTMPVNAAEHNITSPGIHPGDRVVKINGKPIRTWEQVMLAGAIAKPDQVLRVQVERSGENLTFDLKPRTDEQTRLLDLGVASTQSNAVVDYKPDSAEARMIRTVFDRAGLTDLQPSPEMLLTHVNGEPITALWQLSRAIDESNGQSLDLTFADSDGGNEQHVALRTDPDFMLAQVQHDASWYAVTHLLGLVPLPSVAFTEDPQSPEGLKSGDLIERIGDVRWPRADEAPQALTPRTAVPLTVSRGDAVIDVQVHVSRSGSPGFVLDQMPATSTPIIAGTLDTFPISRPGEAGQIEMASPAASLNLMPGTRVISIDGATVPTWRDVFITLRAALSGQAGPSEVAITYELPLPGHPIETRQWSISAEAAEALLAQQWHSELSLSVFQPLLETQKADNPFVAIRMGIDRTWEMIVSTYQTLDRLVRGTIKVDQLKGPVGIAEIGTRVAGQGFPYLLLFLGIINVNLAVLNFLPIPIVDGGLMVFLIIEKLKGSPVSIQVQNAATVVGLLLIGSLFLVTFYNDVLNLISNLVS